MKDQYRDAIEHCISHIASSQDSQGSFGVATFFTSLILPCLHGMKDDVHIQDIANKGVDFLLNERGKEWTWNYWQRNSAIAKGKPYPDDMDDTALALASICLYRPGAITGEALAGLTNTLIKSELEVGGPYNTWIVPPHLMKQWKDKDIAVNSNLAFMLSLQDISLPSIEAFMDECIASCNFTSAYYTSPLSMLYFISRSYKGKLKGRAIKLILKYTKKGRADNPMLTALAITSLINFGAHASLVSSAAKYLKEYALMDEWASYPLYIEEKKEETILAGSSALTAAFVLEALTIYQNASTKKAKKKNIDELFKKKMMELAEYEWSFLSSHTASALSKISEKLIGHDKKDQILLLPYHFTKSLNALKRRKISIRTQQKLGIANLYGWIAYKIYDDLLDDEGDPLLLSAANILLRQTTLIYKDLIPKDAFVIFDSIMNGIDEANAWERRSCRNIRELPDYGNLHFLADKSLGHALGPLTILMRLGFAYDSHEVQKLKLFFIHYIIARQLNDDAHDWLEDLKRGFINSVSVMILELYKDTYEDFDDLDVVRDTRKLQALFCYHILDKVADDIREHTETAKAILASLSFIENNEYLMSLLEPLENAAKMAIFEKDRTEEFLKHYL